VEEAISEMATIANTTADMARDALDRLKVVAGKHSAWLGAHIDEILEIIKAAPDGDAARRDFLAFCHTSPFAGDLWTAGRLVDALRKAGVLRKRKRKEKLC